MASRKQSEKAMYFGAAVPCNPLDLEFSAVKDDVKVDNMLLKEALDTIPPGEECAYMIMMAFSKGHASASAHDIRHGMYGPDWEVAYAAAPNDAHPDAHILYARNAHDRA